ncbi:MAG: hypothetical protein CME62_08145 [Halobacteriovoraceae bacterium]|nr:hypothetical protein [Halobacteriovoraceae bacterium]
MRTSKDELVGTHEFPGGKVEPNELPEVAAAREVLEETNVRIEIPQLMKWKDYYWNKGSQTIWLKIYLYQDKQLQFSDVGYKSFEELLAPTAAIPPANREILADLSAFLVKKAVI